jgi:hypothetical protein
LERVRLKSLESLEFQGKNLEFQTWSGIPDLSLTQRSGKPGIPDLVWNSRLISDSEVWKAWSPKPISHSEVWKAWNSSPFSIYTGQRVFLEKFYFSRYVFVNKHT